MYHIYMRSFARLVQHIQKLRRKLQRLPENSVYQTYKLQKRYERYLQKLIALVSPLAKTGIVAGSAFLLSTTASAQSPSCDTFRLATHSNSFTQFQQLYPTLGKPYFVDIDGDGDLDCYAEYNEDGSNPLGHILFLRNNGTKDIPSFGIDTTSGLPSNLSFSLGIFPGNTDGAKFIDVDGDGDYDCLLGVYGPNDAVIRYFENTGNAKTPVFTERTGAANPFGFVQGYYGLSFTLADLDSDGDYDLVTSASYRQIFYKNVGTKQKPSFKEYQSYQGILGYSYTFYDWDKDGLLDEFTDGNFYYRNTGTAKKPVFTPSGGGPVLPSSGFGQIMQFIDLNNDGFVEIPDEWGNLVTASPDAYIRYDSTRSNTLHAYPRNGDYRYRWQRNGKAISGATNANYTPTQPGTYTVKVTSLCGTGVSLPFKVYVILKQEANNFVADNSLTSLSNGSAKAYPNPFTSSFVMQLNSDADLGRTTIRITDVQGRVVEMMKPNATIVHLGTKLSKGVFIVQVMNDKGVVYQQKVVKE